MTFLSRLAKLWRRLRGIPEPSPTLMQEIIESTIRHRARVGMDNITRNNALLDRLDKRPVTYKLPENYFE